MAGTEATYTDPGDVPAMSWVGISWCPTNAAVRSALSDGVATTFRGVVDGAEVLVVEVVVMGLVVGLVVAGGEEEEVEALHPVATTAAIARQMRVRVLESFTGSF